MTSVVRCLFAVPFCFVTDDDDDDEKEEDLEITLDHHQGIDRDDLQKLVDEKKVELDITRDELDSFKQKNEDLKKEVCSTCCL